MGRGGGGNKGVYGGAGGRGGNKGVYGGFVSQPDICACEIFGKKDRQSAEC